MSEAGSAPSPVEAATKRLTGALDALETALEHRVRGQSSAESLRGEMHLMAADRARLAEDLDEAREHAARLAAANRDVSERIDGAMRTIRAVVSGDEAAGDGDGPDG